ncbi:MAG: prepilin-type N-terminal cleavage/methylation domain-containing protein [Burkholderiales bacterium]
MLRQAIPPRTAGFTLIEAVVTITVAAVLVTIGANVMSNAFRTYFLGREIANDDWQGRYALERMTRELRNVRSASAADLNIGVPGQMTFTDSGSAVIVYRRNAATSMLERSEDGGATFQPLADNIGALSFSYLQNDGQTVAVSAATVYFITVQATVASSNLSTVYRATVKPTAF